MNASKRYQIGEDIESGAQGRVVSAVDTLRNNVVAIKIIPIGNSIGEQGFSNEFTIHKLMKGKSKRIC